MASYTGFIGDHCLVVNHTSQNKLYVYPVDGSVNSRINMEVVLL